MADANFTEFPITARAAAKQNGANKYFTGVPCPNGHTAARYTSTSNCIECLRLASHAAAKDPVKRERTRALHAIRQAAAAALRPPKEPKPITERDIARLSGSVTFFGVDCDSDHGGKRYTSNGQCVICSTQKQSDPAVIERKKQWRLKNIARISAERAAKYEVNKVEANTKARLWAIANPEKRRTISLSYKARRRAIEVRGDSTAVIHAWKISAKKICYWCGDKCRDAFHIDHYEPLSKGGAHEVANLVIACPQCNLTKNAKDPYKFAARSGKLF